MKAEFEFNDKRITKREVKGMFGSEENFKKYYIATVDLFHRDPRISNALTINGGVLKCHFVL